MCSIPTEIRTMSGSTPAATLLGVVELAVRGRGRMDHERAGVADVGQMAEELRGFDEAHAGLVPAPHAESQQAGRAGMAVDGAHLPRQEACCGWSGRPG